MAADTFQDEPSCGRPCLILGSVSPPNCNGTDSERSFWHRGPSQSDSQGPVSRVTAECESACYEGKGGNALTAETKARARKHILVRRGTRATGAQTLSFSLGRTGRDRLGGNIRSGVFVVHDSRRNRHPSGRSIASRSVDLPSGVSGKPRWLFALENGSWNTLSAPRDKTLSLLSLLVGPLVNRRRFGARGSCFYAP